MKSRKCDDSNPKIVKRIFQWDSQQVEISLCKQHKQDPDFSGHISEIPIISNNISQNSKDEYN